MEVMLEIYRTLKTLGMEWKEKKNLGGLGGVKAREARLAMQRAENGAASPNGTGTGARTVERNPQLDGSGGVDLKAASSIYFVETRARVQDVVVLMNLQLYMVDSINYLVDFHHKKTYKASTEPGAGKFDMAHPDFNLSETASDTSRSVKDFSVRDEEVISPFVFMDIACRLILELAGGSE